ncbi:hypothetical protein AB0399_15600 [Streptomyces sp. NPDC088194]|uniref:hypothetical protein n=1 Tax=Streptomyces sp. NPDC088194 TaxID=3154931 RepID=UPI00344B825F
MADELAVELVSAVRREAGAGGGPGVAVAGRRSSPFAGRSWYDFALEYMDVRWRQTAAKTRCEDNEGLCAITLAMIRGRTLRPDEELLRRALRLRAYVVPRPANREVPGDERVALRWVARATRPVDDLLDPEVMKGGYPVAERSSGWICGAGKHATPR